MTNLYLGDAYKEPEELFEAFVTGEDGNAKNGVGLGLAIVRNIFKAYGYKTCIEIFENNFKVCISK